MKLWKFVLGFTITSTPLPEPCQSYSFEPNPHTIALFTSQRGGGGLFSNAVGKVEGKRSEWAEKAKEKAAQLDEQTETTTKELHQKATKVKQDALEKAQDLKSKAHTKAQQTKQDAFDQAHALKDKALQKGKQEQEAVVEKTNMFQRILPRKARKVQEQAKQKVTDTSSSGIWKIKAKTEKVTAAGADNETKQGWMASWFSKK